MSTLCSLLLAAILNLSTTTRMHRAAQRWNHELVRVFKTSVDLGSDLKFAHNRHNRRMVISGQHPWVLSITKRNKNAIYCALDGVVSPVMSQALF